jgi:Protein of unknown function (DUF3455)
MIMISKATLGFALLCCLTGAVQGAETLPDALAAPGHTAVLTVHAVGQQIYECKAGAEGKLAWTFREPTASLTLDEKVVGHHSAGPSWELSDGSAVVGKAIANVAGKGPNDIPWLKLEVTTHRGNGKLTDVTAVQRINTVGGRLEGACDRPGETRGMPYSADYIFLRNS